MLLNNFTLLYVEDDRDTQEQMKALLEDDVKTFFQAYDGEEGLSLYREKKPDIILTDIKMPILDGLEMAAKIKKINKGQPILVMSAFDDRDKLYKAINMGIDGFVTKPVKNIELLMDRLEYISFNLQNKIDVQNSKQKELEQKQNEKMIGLYNLAHYDTLTNIPNRFLFNERLNLAVIKAQAIKKNIVLFFIDLDDFKIINDTYGHKVGDHLLISISKNVKEIIRSSDTFARIGGDEFALIIEDAKDKECLTEFAKKIIKATSSTVYYKNQEMSVSCSIGISQYKKDTYNREDLIHYADKAMYHAKARGKSYFYFYDDIKDIKSCTIN